MKIVAKIISYIIAFFLLLLFSALILLGVTTKTIFNEDYILEKLGKTNYCEKVYNDVIENLSDYVEQSGLDEIDIKNVIKREEVEVNIQELFTKFCNGEELNINQKEIEKQLKANLEEELKVQGKELTESEQEALDKIIETIGKQYTTEVLYGKYFSYLNYIPRGIEEAKKNIVVINKIVYVATCILIIIILIINCRQFRIGLRCLGVASLANGILMIFINLFVKNSIDTQNFFILNRAISDLINVIIIDMISNINVVGIITSIIGIVLIIIGATHKEKI